MSTTTEEGVTLPVSLHQLEESGEPAPWDLGTADPPRGWYVTLCHDHYGAAGNLYDDRSPVNPRTLTVPFWQGPAITTDPTAADVLGCLLGDAATIETTHDFEDWAEELGYLSSGDLDAAGLRRLRETYELAVELTDELRAFLGEDYDRAVWGES